MNDRSTATIIVTNHTLADGSEGYQIASFLERRLSAQMDWVESATSKAQGRYILEFVQDYFDGCDIMVVGAALLNEE